MTDFVKPPEVISGTQENVLQKEISEDDILKRIKESQAGITSTSDAPKNSIDPVPSTQALPSVGNSGHEFTGAPDVENIDGPVKAKEGLLGLISPKTAVNLFDIIMARVSVIGARWANVDAGKNDFKLDAQEKATIEPHLAACLERLKMQSENPFINLAVCIVLIYGIKIADLADRQGSVIPKKERMKIKTEGMSNTATPKSPEGDLKKSGRGRKGANSTGRNYERERQMTLLRKQRAA